MREIELNDNVRDRVTGFQGVVTGHCEYSTGCDTYLVQPPLAADGTFQKGLWFDGERLAMVT